MVCYIWQVITQHSFQHCQRLALTISQDSHSWYCTWIWYLVSSIAWIWLKSLLSVGGHEEICKDKAPSCTNCRRYAHLGHPVMSPSVLTTLVMSAPLHLLSALLAPVSMLEWLTSELLARARCLNILNLAWLFFPSLFSPLFSSPFHLYWGVSDMP